MDVSSINICGNSYSFKEYLVASLFLFLFLDEALCTIGPMIELIDVYKACQPRFEVLIVLGLGLNPLHLGKCSHAGENLILDLRLTGDVFCPQVGLCSENVMSFVGRKVFGYGFEVIDLLERIAATEGCRLVPCAAGLVVVKIQWAHGRHDHVMPEFSTLGSRLGSSPRHDGGRRVHVTGSTSQPSSSSQPMMRRPCAAR